MNRLRLSIGILSLGIAAVACGQISDPTKDGEGTVSTISGALTGTSVPQGAHVALVWKKVSGGLEVGADTAIVDGKFTLNLGVPSANYFFPYESKGYDRLTGGSAPSVGTDEPAPSTPPSTEPVPEPDPAPGGKVPSKISPQDSVSGQITQPLNIAVAGFVVYVDANGNGKLDLVGDYGDSPDTILGGNDELLLAYLKDGGSLDYEKLRDRSGILPKAGYNLAWERGRWLPLNLVELQITKDTNLPSAVCESTGAINDPTPPNTAEPVPIPGEEVPDNGTNYPQPGDPNLKCAPDGRSFEYHQPCPEPPPPPVGLCAGGGYDVARPGCVGGYGTALASGEPVPEGWPCPVSDGGTTDPDGGAMDGGQADAGADGG